MRSRSLALQVVTLVWLAACREERAPRAALSESPWPHAETVAAPASTPIEDAPPERALPPLPPLPPPTVLLPARPPPTPVPASPPAPTSPSRASSSGVDACTAPGDCVIDCPDVPGCCHSACGCRTAVNAARKKDFEASYATTCRRPPHCLVEGCDYEPAGGATCRDGRCVATKGPSF